MPTVRLNVFIRAKSIRDVPDSAMLLSLMLTPSAQDGVLGGFVGYYKMRPFELS